MKKIIIITAIVSAITSSLYTAHLVIVWKKQHVLQKVQLKEKYETAYRNTREELNSLAQVQSKFSEYFLIAPSKEQIQKSLEKSPHLICAEYVCAKDKKVLYTAGINKYKIRFPENWTTNENGSWIGVKRGRDSYTLFGFYATPIKDESQNTVNGYLIGCYELPKTAIEINNLIYTFSSFGEIIDDKGIPVVHPFLNTKLAKESSNVVSRTPEYIEPLPSTNGWKIAFHLNGGDLMPENIPLLKKKLAGGALWGITALLLLAIILKAHKGSTLSLSILAGFFILNCLFVIAFITSKFLTNSQLNHSSAHDIKKIYEKIAEYHSEAVVIPTLVQIENISFVRSTSYVLSGFVQQTYPKDYNDEVGIIFPDLLKSSKTKMTQISRIVQEDEVVYTWQFTLEMGKIFPLKNFPLDRRTLDLVMWPISMNKKVFLIPDTVGYEDMRPNALLGVSSSVKVDNWEIEHSFFGLNFRQFPTFEKERLPFNTEFKIVVQRSLSNAFLTNLMPLFICTILTYALLCIPLKRIASPTLPVISIVIATIFVVTLNQTSVRNSLGIHSFAYVEFLYTAYYILLLLMTANFILFTTSKKPFLIIGYRNNLVPKLLYWPFLILAYTVVMYLGFV